MQSCHSPTAPSNWHTEYDDAKYRSAGIRLNYQARSDCLPGIKDGIPLEVGFDDTASKIPCTISAWALDSAMNSSVRFIDNRAVPYYILAYIGMPTTPTSRSASEVR